MQKKKNEKLGKGRECQTLKNKPNSLQMKHLCVLHISRCVSDEYVLCISHQGVSVICHLSYMPLPNWYHPSRGPHPLTTTNSAPLNITLHRLLLHITVTTYLALETCFKFGIDIRYLYTACSHTQKHSNTKQMASEGQKPSLMTAVLWCGVPFVCLYVCFYISY